MANLAVWSSRVLAAVAFAATLGVASAQTPAADERMALATEYAALAGPAQFAAAFDPMAQSMWPGLESQFPAAVDRAFRDELREFFVDGIVLVMTERMALILDEVLPAYALAVAEVYTADELRAWIDFYESPVGRKLLDLQMSLTGQVAISIVGDPYAINRVAVEAMNPVLRRFGLGEYPVSAEMPAAAFPASPVMTADAIAARPLVPMPREMMADMALELATESIAGLWLQVEPYLPANADVRDSVFVALDAGVTEYFVSMVEPLVDQMALGMATGLSPDELAGALAFYASPEAASRDEKTMALDALTGDLINDATMPVMIGAYAGIIGVMNDVNEMLGQRGFPPIPF